MGRISESLIKLGNKCTFDCWKSVIMVLRSRFSITKGYDQYNIDQKIIKLVYGKIIY
jgi:hypothetical protein